MRTIRFLLAAILLGGCERYAGPTEASGLVVDAHTRQPVAYATVQALSSSSGASGGGTSGGRSTQADGQGRFALRFEAQSEKDYQLLAYTAGGYSNQGDGPFVTGGSRNDNLVVPVDAPAWVRIVCVDDPPASKIGLSSWGYDGSGDNQSIGPGSMSFTRPIGSYSSRNITWDLTNEFGKTIRGRQAVNTIGFDTATVTIHF